MDGRPRRLEDERRRQARARLGMRRLDRVLIEVRGTDVTCTAYGASHRLPRIRRVSLPVAVELAAQGVPTAVVRRDVRRRPPRFDACQSA